ncbi:LacI family DNA-binding transcriptional regulator [Paenibacillaceae bacterium WGS1546]|uniref:LacI family DNA-binding transcriptional regulator n=1 Tax=Cohnella sp. WGS1546 TaxID=3366810 RepID=UPI00372D4E8E
MRVTIKDVARECGFSVTTVSLVLNNKECRVSEAAKAKILGTAARMNYRPNHLAVGLVTKKTHTVGVIVPDISNFHFAEMSKAIEQECRANGYIVLLGSYGDSDEQAAEYFSEFIGKGVEGIIFAKPLVKNPSVKELQCYESAQAAKVPVVTFEPAGPKIKSQVVTFDYREGGYMATKHLLDYGHRRIGYISGGSSMLSSIAREEGYKLALKEAGVEYDPELLFEGDFGLESGIRALPYLLGKNASAIFAFNDMMALGVYKAARSYNLTIPSDFSIVGFDDSFMNEILEIPLTSIVHPAIDLGRESARQVLRLIRGEPVNKAVVFRPSLKVRGSTRRLF